MCPSQGTSFFSTRGRGFCATGLLMLALACAAKPGFEHTRDGEDYFSGWVKRYLKEEIV